MTDRVWTFFGAIVVCLVILVVVFDRIKKPPIQEELLYRAVYVCEILVGGYGYTPPNRLTPKQLEDPNQKFLYEKFRVVETEAAVLKCVSGLVGGVK